MKIKFSSFSDEYEVKDGTVRGRITLTNTRTGRVFKDYYIEGELDEGIAKGSIKVTEADKDTKAVEFLKVGVDSSELANALALAKELEATMLRIRGLFK